MQLDMFSAATPQAVDLRSTTLPQVAAVADHIGTAQSWDALTLSQVLELWYSAYTEFVEALELPIDHARSFCKENGANYEAGGPLARKFYQKEYQRLSAGYYQLRCVAENLLCAHMTNFIEQAQAHLRAPGAPEEDVEASYEFINTVFQRPNPEDLSKLLPVLVTDLADEYLRLQE